MAKENKTKYALLGVLSLGPASGYDIKKYCDASIAHFWNENYGHIYPVLRQMEAEGLVGRKTEMNEGKARHVYHMTEQGRTALLDWLAVPSETPSTRYEFLLKMYFSSEIPTSTVIGRLEESKVFCDNLLGTYQCIADHMRQAMENNPACRHKTRFQLATVLYGIRDVQAKIAWCEDCLTMLKEEMP
jgi:DNA-binding PadR family transcriptional regulator